MSCFGAHVLSICTVLLYGAIEHGRGQEQEVQCWKGVTSLGTDFVTAFLQNTNSNEVPQWEILVTGTSDSTNVSIAAFKTDFKKDVKVGKEKTVVIPITNPTELKGTGICPHPVVIKADAEITVMSRNYKGNSGDVALIYPTHQMGVQYYVITPPNGPANEYKEFSVVSHKNPTIVDIYLKGAVNFRGKNYQKGDKMTVNLEPFQAVQVQSKDDLSGSRVVSQYPVAVITGHTCAQRNRGCGHVYEQLQPVGTWGTSFFVPIMSFQPKYDIVMLLASQNTCIQYQSGEKKVRRNVEAGELTYINLTMTSPLSIHSTDRIQVLLYGTGGKFKNKPFGSFLTKIPDINNFDLAYNLIGQDKFDMNLAIIIAKTSSGPGITFNGEVPKDIEWKVFPESEYSWTEYSYGGGFSSNIVQHSTTPFGLLSIGYSMNMAYGSVAPGVRAFLDEDDDAPPVMAVYEMGNLSLPEQVKNEQQMGGTSFPLQDQQEQRIGTVSFPVQDQQEQRIGRVSFPVQDQQEQRIGRVSFPVQDQQEQRIGRVSFPVQDQKEKRIGRVSFPVQDQQEQRIARVSFPVQDQQEQRIGRVSFPVQDQKEKRIGRVSFPVQDQKEKRIGRVSFPVQDHQKQRNRRVSFPVQDQQKQRNRRVSFPVQDQQKQRNRRVSFPAEQRYGNRPLSPQIHIKRGYW